MNLLIKVVIFPLYFIAVVTFIASFCVDKRTLPDGTKEYSYMQACGDALSQWWE